MNEQQRQREIFETLVQNAQKGEYYTVKFKDDPVLYTAIPLIHYSMDTSNDTMFILKVVEPAEHKGIYKESVEKIELLERKAG